MTGFNDTACRASSPEIVLVTGVAGFIGSHLAEALLRLGHVVIGVDRRSPQTSPIAAGNLRTLLAEPGFRFCAADITVGGLSSLLTDVRTVFHLAGETGVRRSWGRRFADYTASNILATQRLLEASDEAGVPRVVVASSSSVYGETSGGPSREDSAMAPVSPYGVSKLAAERLALAYARRPGARMSVIALRYFTVYGPRQRDDMVVARMFRAALTGTPMQIYGDGGQRRSFTYVDDAVAATVYAGWVEAEPEAVNVAGPDCVPLRAVREQICALTGRPVPIVSRGSHPGDVTVTCADLTRARELLRYEPRVGLAEGLARQWRWMTGGLPAGVLPTARRVG